MRYLIWDFDGTIAEREGMWRGALVEAAALHGFQTTREVVRPFLRSGFPWHQPEIVRAPNQAPELWWRTLEQVFVRAYVEGAQASVERATKMSRSVRECFLALDNWRVFEDVGSCLELLSRSGWRHVILSNHVPELEILVEHLGLSECFESVFTSGVTGVEKPHPNAFRMVQESVGQTEELYMIGDNWAADICGATEAGIEGILVRNPHDRAERYCQTLAELTSLLDEI